MVGRPLDLENLGIVTGDDLVKKRQTTKPLGEEDEKNRFEGIKRRLLLRFGSGDNPRLRHQFFENLERCVEQHGLEAYEQICEAVTDAAKATSPARFFCAAIKARLSMRNIQITQDRLF